MALVEFWALTDDSVITECVKSLISMFDLLCDPVMQIMLKSSWSTVDTVRDKSDYMKQMIVILVDKSALVKNFLKEMKYYHAFCDRLVEFAPSLA